MNRAPSVYVIVLNWNGKHHLADCLGSLVEIDYPNATILLVDNGSIDGSTAYVQKMFPTVQILKNKTNLHFAKGNNVGIRHALEHGADYVVLVNNDTRVEPDFLSYLVKRGEECEDIGVLGGTVLMFSNPEVVNSTGVNLNFDAYGWDRDFGEAARTLDGKGGEVLAVTGGLFAVKRKVFEEIGLLEESLIAYYEDVDFCIRAWRDTRFRIEYVPSSVIYHKFSASSSSEFKAWLMLRNRYWIFFKHYPLREILLRFPRIVMHRIPRILHGCLHGHAKLSVREALLLTMYWFSIPVVVVRRFVGRAGRKDNTARFWQWIVKKSGPPLVKVYQPGYERVYPSKMGLRSDDLASRIVCGINDEVLGCGWSRLKDGAPRTREMSAEAVCFLLNSVRCALLQVHGLSSEPHGGLFLEVLIEGDIVGRQEIRHGWKTYLFPFNNKYPNGPVEVKLKIRSTDLNQTTQGVFRVNEIALLTISSPLLRAKSCR